jgi:hypothetical protein
VQFFLLSQRQTKIITYVFKLFLTPLLILPYWAVPPPAKILRGERRRRHRSAAPAKNDRKMSEKFRAQKQY